ncbi:MAG: molybdopterin-dependent oxidoreductase [Actinobacteria bacterium]|nr:molybdopterin-dependent oxidoreductase [Actinomycetota bacterium]
MPPYAHRVNGSEGRGTGSEPSPGGPRGGRPGDRPGGRAPWGAAVAGVAAAGLALAATEVVGVASPATPTLLQVVGNWLVERFAGSLRDVAVQLFGTNDKRALVIGTVLVSLALGAAVGRLALRRPAAGPVAFSFAAAAGIAAGLTDPIARDHPIPVVAAGVAGAVVGAVALRLLLVRALGPSSGARRAPLVRPGPSGEAGPDGGTAPARVARRRMLTWAVTALGISAGSAWFAGALRGRRAAASAAPPVPLPAAADVAAVPAGSALDAAVPGITPLITSNADFYRIDTALDVPRIAADRWRLRITGLVEREVEHTYRSLLARELVEVPITIQCVSNEVGGDLVGTARWRGVPLAALLDEARPRPDATQVVGVSADGFTAGFPTRAVTDGRHALVAVGMNGRPLPAVHGFPARLVVAGLYGYVSATKWLTEIRLTRLEDFDGFWIPRGWAKEGPIKTASRIDVPTGSDAVRAGRVVVAGVAWAPARGIRAVQVRVDRGPWRDADVAPAASDDLWVQWRWSWDATPGTRTLQVRAVDGTGALQDGRAAPPAPDGATGWHTRTVTVRR